MKKNNKGFLLVETLVVSTFCLTVLVILFLQFKNLIINYNTSFKYNTVEGIYNLGTIKKHIQSNNITFNDPTFIYKDNNNDNEYGANEYGNNCDDFCKKLVQAENIKVLVYTGSTVNDAIKNAPSLSQEFKRFISQLKQNSKTHRLIAEFHDGTYASITY